MSASLPTGTVTFLFTDIEGSTRLWQQYPDTMVDTLARHHALLRLSIEENDGYIFQIIGDAFCAAFPTATKAVNAAESAQRALQTESWSTAQALRVRMGIHTGAVEIRAGEYQSNLTLIRVQRIMSAGHGGQVLLSLTTEELVHDRLPAESHLRDLGVHQLKGLARPERIFQLAFFDLPSDFPPLRSEAQSEAQPDTQTALGRIARAQMVGRAEPVRRTLERLDRLKSGAGGTVIFSGEPGIGKTRLIDEMIVAAKTRGYSVLVGRCHERDSAIPYLPVSEAIEALARASAPATWQRLLQAAGGDISALLSDSTLKHYGRFSAGGTTNASVGAMLTAHEFIRPERSVLNMLAALAQTSPVVLVMDDLHWADAASLEVVRHVALHCAAVPILVLGAYREIELERTHPLSRLLVELNRERVLTRERLRRLHGKDTRELLSLQLGDPLPRGLAELVHEQTEGNPFFVEELVSGLVEDSLLVADAETHHYDLAPGLTIEALAGQVPEGIRAAIGARLDRLDGDTQQTLGLAAIIGRRFSLDLLRGLAAAHGLSDEEVDTSMERACASRFTTPLDVIATSPGDVAGFTSGAADIRADYAFDHPLIHQVVYAELDRRRRRRLHAEAGRRLEELCSGRESLYAERIATHYLDSDDDAKALQYSLIAGDKMYRAYYDPDMALGYYLPALEAVVAKDLALRNLGAKSPVPIRHDNLHRFTPAERESLVAYLQAILPAAARTTAAKAVALLANRICVMAMHTGEVYQASIRLYEQCILGPDVQKLVVQTERGQLVGILEFPAPGGPYPVVLLFHGSPSSKETLADEAQRYWKLGLATLRVDLPGFGETTVATTLGGEDGEILKPLVSAVLAHERVDKRGVGIVGWSYGPWVAAHLCARDKRVLAMVGISGEYDLREDTTGHSAGWPAFIRARWQAGTWPSPEVDFPYPADHSVFPVAAQIRCPLLLVYGAMEHEYFRTQNEKLAALVPSAKTRVWRSGVHALINMPEALEDAAEWMQQQLIEIQTA